MGGAKQQLLEIAEAERTAEAERAKMAKTNEMLWDMLDRGGKDKKSLEKQNEFLKAENANLRRVLQEHTTAIAALMQSAADADDHIHHKQQECWHLRDTLQRVLQLSAGSIPPDAGVVLQGHARPEISGTTLEAAPQ